MSGEELTIALSGDDLRLRLFWDAGNSRPMLGVSFRGMNSLAELEWRIAFDSPQGTRMLRAGRLCEPREYPAPVALLADCVEYCERPEETRDALRPRIAKHMCELREKLTRECEQICAEAKAKTRRTA